MDLKQKPLECLLEASWKPLEASGSFALEASGSLWKLLGASGSLLEPLGASGSLWEPLEASGSLWEPLGASGSLWKPLEASASLWQPLRASGSLPSSTVRAGPPLKHNGFEAPSQRAPKTQWI